MYDIEDEGDEYFITFFRSGAESLAENLGLKDEFDLRDWADRNPEYWGNEHGETMFTCKKAFGKTEQEALSLKEIPDWYMNVSKRLRGEEEKLYVL